MTAEGRPDELGLPTAPATRFVSAGRLTVVHEGVCEYELLPAHVAPPVGGGTGAVGLLTGPAAPPRPTRPRSLSNRGRNAVNSSGASASSALELSDISTVPAC